MSNISLILLGQKISVLLLGMMINDIAIVIYPYSFGNDVVFFMILDHTSIFAELHFIAFIVYLTNDNQIVLKALQTKSFNELRSAGGYKGSYPKDFGDVSITKNDIFTLNFL